MRCRYCGKAIRLKGRVTCGHPVCRRKMNRGEAPPVEALWDAVARMQEAGASSTEIVDKIAMAIGVTRAEAIHIAREEIKR